MLLVSERLSSSVSSVKQEQRPLKRISQIPQEEITSMSRFSVHIARIPR